MMILYKNRQFDGDIDFLLLVKTLEHRQIEWRLKNRADVNNL